MSTPRQATREQSTTPSAAIPKTSIYKRRYYRKHREQIKAKRRAARAANPDFFRARDREWRHQRIPKVSAKEGERFIRDAKLEEHRGIKNYVVCRERECFGKFRKIQAKHLRLHGLTAKQYQQKWKDAKGHVPPTMCTAMRAEQSKRAVDTWANREVRARRIAALNKPEVRARQSAALKKACAKPEVRARKSAAQKKSWNNPQVRARRSAAQKKAQGDPEVRARHSAAQKKLWAELASLRELAAHQHAATPAAQPRNPGGRPRGMSKERQEEAMLLLKHVAEFQAENGTKHGAKPYAALKVYGTGTDSRRRVERANKTLRDYETFKQGQKLAS